MRIIAGIYKGFTLFSPKGKHLRPTADRIREFIFSYIGDEIIDKQVLDLFCGTGSLGIEALSRGAKETVFVDVAASSIALVKRNLAKVGIEAKTVKMDAGHFLKKAHLAGLRWDFIFNDPPYDYPYFNKILQLIQKFDILSEDGTVVYESGSRNETIRIDGFTIRKQKKMGDTLITFYQAKDERERKNSHIPRLV
jgi:16S rRNA (guanine966-N2)-methyltransferase